QMNMKILLVMSLLMVINLVVGISKYNETSNTINNTAGMLLFTLLATLLCVTKEIDSEKFYSSFKLIAVISTFFLVFQFIFNLYTHNLITGKLPFLIPLDNAYFGSLRPSSFFSE